MNGALLFTANVLMKLRVFVHLSSCAGTYVIDGWSLNVGPSQRTRTLVLLADNRKRQ